MGGTFSTSDAHSHLNLKPLRVPTLREDVYREALDMVESLDAWTLVSESAEAGRIVCKRKGGMLGGESTITIVVEGPEGIPSTTVHVTSETEGGLLSRDKSNVMEFMKPFHRRIC